MLSDRPFPPTNCVYTASDANWLSKKKKKKLSETKFKTHFNEIAKSV